MSDPVNLENLHEMTDNDVDLEKELFNVFVTSSETCLAALRASCTPGTEETWRTQAHAWKGMSLNLGADTLGALCAEAQKNNMASGEEKTILLAAIEKAYEDVKTFLQPLL